MKMQFLQIWVIILHTMPLLLYSYQITNKSDNAMYLIVFILCAIAFIPEILNEKK